MRCAVTFHAKAAEDIRRYRKLVSQNELGLNLTALVDEQVRELKRLLAQTGGSPPGVQELVPGQVKGDDGIFEFEYVSGTIWVRFSRTRSRTEIRVTILRWSQAPCSPQ